MSNRDEVRFDRGVPVTAKGDLAIRGWVDKPTLTVPALRPIEDVDLTRPLLALDVDGALQRWWGVDYYGRKLTPGPKTVNVRTDHGDKFIIDFFPDRIEELHRIVTTHQVNIGWLTSWGPNVKPIIEQAFDGLLAGGFVLKKMPAKWRGHRPADWKYTGLRDHLTAHPTPWAWVDDEQIAIAEQFEPTWLPTLTALAPGLPVHTDEEEAITEDDLARLDAFFASHANRGN